MRMPRMTRCARLTSIAFSLILMTWLVMTWLVTAAEPARANPLPDGLILIHVQPASPDFCSSSTITSCSEITQYSELTGVVEFDLFLFPVFFEPPVSVCSLQTTVEWPAGWSFLDWEPCHGGAGPIELTETSASLDIVFPGCAEAGTEVFLLARFLMMVDGQGAFGSHNWFDTIVEINYAPGETYEMHPWLTTGEAGVECAYCWTSCDFADLCRPDPEVTVLDLEIPQGEIAQEQFLVTAYGGFMSPCSVDFLPSESWLQVEGVPGDTEWEWVVTLTVDTSDLDMGNYSGWVRMESDCVGCTKVNLQVASPVTGVPGDGVPADGPTSAATWGLLKALYR